ncbi:MAG: SRPBCC family protein [Acidobacteriota bacterium]
MTLEPGIVNTRLFGVPREVLFEAFSDPDQLVHWWGPKGFTNVFHEFDLRPGGSWRFVMHGPDGAEFQIEKEFIEVARPERIVLRHLDAKHGFRMTMTFADEPGGTRLTWHMLFEDPEENTRLREFISEANEQNFDRLAAWLTKKARP